MSSKYLITFRPKLALSHFETDYRWIVWSLQQTTAMCKHCCRQMVFLITANVALSVRYELIYYKFCA